MADEPTPGELVRRMEAGFSDLKEDLRDLAGRLDKKVSQELYDVRHNTLMERVQALETLRKEDADKLIATRRWLIGAVIVPVVGILLPVVMLVIQGTGS